MSKKVALSEEQLESVNGGSIGFNPDKQGTYTMICEFSGAHFYNVKIENIMDIIAFGATIPNTPEGEQDIINYARDKGYIK